MMKSMKKLLAAINKVKRKADLFFICDLPAWWSTKKKAKEEMQEFGFPLVSQQWFPSVIGDDKKRAEPELSVEIWSPNTVVQVQISN